MSEGLCVAQAASGQLRNEQHPSCLTKTSIPSRHPSPTLLLHPTSSASTQPYQGTTVSTFGGDTHVYATDTQYLLRNCCIGLKQFAWWPGVAPCCNLQGVPIATAGNPSEGQMRPHRPAVSCPLHTCIHST